MSIITLDFETYYDPAYSLSKMTTESYIRDPRFEVIGVAVKVDNEPTVWFSGTHEETRAFLYDSYDWENSFALAHNTMFDGAIMSWRFGIKPKVWLDTLCMSRALHGIEVGGSLKVVAERYGVGEKGTEVVAAKGKRRADFTDEELARYASYCVNDVDLTHDIFSIMGRKFPKGELKLIDLTLRMYIDPVLDLDTGLLEMHIEKIKDWKDQLMIDAGITDKKELMSNQKFAELLRGFDVVPPTKISATTGKETYAFAKSDEGFKALAEDEDVRVQLLVAARLGNKSTLEETRTQRFIDISKRGLLPVPIRYYAAHTGRWGGDDKINLQNLPSRGPNAKALKRSIIAPEGQMIIEADSAQIEARVLAWLAEQEDLVTAFTNKEDVYKKMASKIYDVQEEDVTKEQRFVGKTTILGAGYGMGAIKFQAQLKNFGTDIELREAQRIIEIYREANDMISQLWRDANNSIEYMYQGSVLQFGRQGVLEVVDGGVRLPSGLVMRYDDLRGEQDEKGVEYTYKTRRGRTRIYGGKVIENVCQGIARCIIGEQMLKIAKRYRVVLTVHDSIACCVPYYEADYCKAYVEECMRWTPDWAKGLPVDCEAGIGVNYGDTE
jgi:DNA polymerase I-like protein with 3'-5' exonuclease and polymerase domains